MFCLSRDIYWHTLKKGSDLRAGVLADINGVLYAFGGYSDDSPYPKKVYAYNDDADTWTAKADMPTPRAEFAVAVWTYTYSGSSSVNWIKGADMPDARYGHGAVT
jgi:N-acetylneuraminic acid mutarotase